MFKKFPHFAVLLTLVFFGGCESYHQHQMAGYQKKSDSDTGVVR